MKKKSIGALDQNRWIVANDSDFKEARKKKLFKATISLPAKKDIKLCITHINDLIWLVGDAIKQAMIVWHEAGGEAGTDRWQHLMHLESLLYMIEDLLPYKPMVPGSFRNGDGPLFHHLSLIRWLVAFPPLVEKFYKTYEVYDAQVYQSSPTCGICGGKKANMQYVNIITHADCPVKYGWYSCEECGWLYPSNKWQCRRKSICRKKQLVSCKETGYGNRTN